MLDQHIKSFLLNDARERFCKYVRIATASDPESDTHPSTKDQWDLARLLEQELTRIDLLDIELDSHCYVYATLPACGQAKGPPITLCAHLDTSPSESGTGVMPVIHENYDGGVIAFEKSNDLQLGPDDSPELLRFVGHNIITSAGDTLLGADDKAGIAEIMAALAAFCRFDTLRHPELRIVFTPDEEIGQGTDHIDLNRLGKFGYTIDGGIMGVVEEECFDAFEATLTFTGRNIHPGYAKNKMINAGAISARFVAALPEYETPEHTEKREGFLHVTDINGDENRAVVKIILRDFEKEKNSERIELLRRIIRTFEVRYTGLKIKLELKDQYSNMRQIIARHPAVVSKACRAIEAAGLEVIKKPVRGGTDGAQLSFKGVPTPNIFAGGLMFHSKTEWIPEVALQKAAEVIIHLCRLWAEEGE